MRSQLEASIQRMPNLVRPHQYGKQLGEELIFWGDGLFTFFRDRNIKMKNITIHTETEHFSDGNSNYKIVAVEYGHRRHIHSLIPIVLILLDIHAPVFSILTLT